MIMIHDVRLYNCVLWNVIWIPCGRSCIKIEFASKLLFMQFTVMLNYCIFHGPIHDMLVWWHPSRKKAIIITSI